MYVLENIFVGSEILKILVSYVGSVTLFFVRDLYSCHCQTLVFEIYLCVAHACVVEVLGVVCLMSIAQLTKNLINKTVRVRYESLN